MSEKVAYWRDRIGNSLVILQDLRCAVDRVPEYTELAGRPGSRLGVKPQRNRTAPDPSTRCVFVVHGHADVPRLTVCRFLERLKLKPIVLHEQVSAGLTIIEKLEKYSSVAFALVLLTGDDVGMANRDDASLQARARQNVVLELGYFLGRLGRQRVCALYENGVEIPSDYAGVAYVSMSGGVAWELEVARELKGAGFDVDLNVLS